MYTVAPIYRDKELVTAAALTVFFTLFTVALAATANHFTDSPLPGFFAGLGMAPVIRTYAAETAREFRGYRTRVAMAARARECAAVTEYHRDNAWRSPMP